MNVLLSIMSYNRGEFLENLIESIESLFDFPYQLLIFDDNSDDLYTISVLKKYTKYVFQGEMEAQAKSFKHKGLYGNMNLALKEAYKMEANYLMIFQDDTQVIRKVDVTDLKSISRIFQVENIGQIVCTFFKKNHQKPYSKLLDYDSKSDAFYPATGNSSYMLGIADMGVYDLSKLVAKGWFFESNEGDNLLKGKQLNLNRAVLRFPFLAFLPWPSVHRYKGTLIKKLLSRFCDYYYRAGFHPLNYLNDVQRDEIFSKYKGQILFEDDLLTLKSNLKLEHPWNFYQSSWALKRRVKLFLGMKLFNKN